MLISTRVTYAVTVLTNSKIRLGAADADRPNKVKGPECKKRYLFCKKNDCEGY